MKKKYISSLLSVGAAIGLLTLTSCGNNDTSVSAMNDTPIPTETQSETETTPITETTSTKETETQNETEVRGEGETIDSSSTTIPFEEGEERGEDAPPAESTEPAETVRKAPFTVDDFDFPESNELFNSAEDMKEYIQLNIDDYEAGLIDYNSLLSALADVGIDNTKLAEDYDKSQGIDSTSTNTDTTVIYPEGYDREAAGLVPEGAVTEETTVYTPHPELSDVHVY